MSMLMVACDEGVADVVRWLLEMGVDVDERHAGDGTTAVHLAAKRGHVDCLRELVRFHANLSLADKVLGWTVLHQAACAGREAVARVAIEAVVSTRGRASASSLLLQADRTGATCLHVAAQHGHAAVAEALCTVVRDSGVELAEHEADRSTPLHSAAQAGHKAVVDLLVAQDVDVNAVDVRGFTALHVACRAGRLECVEQLMRGGIDADIRSSIGDTARALVDEQVHVEIVRRLDQYASGAFPPPETIGSDFSCSALLGLPRSVTNSNRNLRFADDFDSRSGGSSRHVTPAASISGRSMRSMRSVGARSAVSARSGGSFRSRATSRRGSVLGDDRGSGTPGASTAGDQQSVSQGLHTKQTAQMRGRKYRSTSLLAGQLIPENGVGGYSVGSGIRESDLTTLENRLEPMLNMFDSYGVELESTRRILRGGRLPRALALLGVDLAALEGNESIAEWDGTTQKLLFRAHAAVLLGDLWDIDPDDVSDVAIRRAVAGDYAVLDDIPKAGNVSSDADSSGGRFMSDDDDDDDDAYSYYTSDGEADSLGGVVEGDAPSLPHRNGQQSSMADLLAASLTRISVESDDVDADAGPTAHRRRRRRHSSQDASGTPLVETRSMLLAKAQERERRRLARRAAAAAATCDASDSDSDERRAALERVAQQKRERRKRADCEATLKWRERPSDDKRHFAWQ